MTSERPATPLPNPDAPPCVAPALPAADTQPAPPLAPEGTSPWWHAPGGKPVDIPAFG